MEIERKWMVSGWPEGLPEMEAYEMEQGYISVRPTVRIRKEALVGGETKLILCFKGKPSSDGLSRQEIETEIDAELFEKLKDLIGKPLIKKVRRTYALPDGMHLEVNQVDEGLPSAFWYAEIEYPSEEAAKSWKPEDKQLAEYLKEDCTGQPGSSMGDYWEQTRLTNSDCRGIFCHGRKK